MPFSPQTSSAQLLIGKLYLGSLAVLDEFLGPCFEPVQFYINMDNIHSKMSIRFSRFDQNHVNQPLHLSTLVLLRTVQDTVFVG